MGARDETAGEQPFVCEREVVADDAPFNPWTIVACTLVGALAGLVAAAAVGLSYLRSNPDVEYGSLVVPFAVYVPALYGIYAAFTRHLDPFHLSLLAGTAGVIALAVVLAAAGAGVAVCLVVLMFAPVVTVLGYETLGHRHVEEALRRMRPTGSSRQAA